MNNGLVLCKAMSKREYLKTLYSNNVKWNKLIESLVEDMEDTIQEFSARPIRRKSCMNALNEILAINDYNLQQMHLKKTIMDSFLCDSCYSNYGLTGKHELKVDMNNVEVVMKYDVGEYEQGEKCHLSITEYFELNERAIVENSHYEPIIIPPRNRASVQETTIATVSIVLDKEYIRERNIVELEKRGFFELSSEKMILSEYAVFELEVSEIFEQNVSKIILEFSNGIFGERANFVIKNTKNWRNNIAISIGLDSTSDFVDICYEYIK
jgi:hypothetical protein